MDRLRNVRLASRTIAWLILGALIIIGLYAFFNSRFGQTALLVCCGGIIVLVIVGILSENGMRRR